MIKAYDALGMTDLRDDAARVMRKNFPESRFLADSTGVDAEPWWKFW
jgi:outer membrane protein assembly factor BamD